MTDNLQNKKDDNPTKDLVEGNEKIKNKNKDASDPSSVIKAVHKEEVEESSTLVEWLQFNVLPIFITLFFVAMLVIFVIPQINEISGSLDQIDKLVKEVDSKDEVIEKIIGLKADQFSNAELLEVIDILVPSSATKVVEYKEKLSQVVKSANLEVLGIKAGEIVKEDDELFVDPADRSLHIIIVPTEVSAKGTIDQLKQFLSNLYLSQDFFVVEEMDISKSSEEFTWKAEFVIVKYQFGGKVFVSENEFEQVASSKPNADVIDFLNRKFPSVNVNPTQ